MEPVGRQYRPIVSERRETENCMDIKPCFQVTLRPAPAIAGCRKGDAMSDWIDRRFKSQLEEKQKEEARTVLMSKVNTRSRGFWIELSKAVVANCKRLKAEARKEDSLKYCVFSQDANGIKLSPKSKARETVLSFDPSGPYINVAEDANTPEQITFDVDDADKLQVFWKDNLYTEEKELSGVLIRAACEEKSALADIP